MAEVLALIAGVAVMVWLFRMGYLYWRWGRRGSIAGAAAAGATSVLFWFLSLPWFLWKYVGAKRRLGRLAAGKSLGDVYRP